ncbi:hypothetical protein N9006_02460, partial [bacterium]|nr:hypothetical protein [bacterium]
SRNYSSDSTSSQGGLGVRMRGDLICVQRIVGGHMRHVIKDPLRMTYYDYGDEDFFILQSLDGQRTGDVIASEFQARFGKALEGLHLKNAIEAFVRDNLVRMFAQGQGSLLFKNRQRPLTLAMQNIARNPVVIKFSGLDLSKAFDALVPLTRWMVNPFTVVVIIGLVLSSAILLLFNLTEFQQRLPLATEFFAVRNVIWMMLALGCTKVLHELGHALTCIHYGAECHRVGVMLLVFTPCLYCDVSDAWMLKNKWKRIAIASAGILTELALASICTFLWWYSEPGFLNSLCLNVVFICGVGTVVFNGNPLLKYDGYYMLSDFLGVSNLWTRSRTVLRMNLDSLLWGLPKSKLIGIDGRLALFLLFYALCSIAYRLVVVVGILFLIVAIMNEFKLFQLAVGFSVFVLVGSFVLPASVSIKRIARLVKKQRITPFRFGVVSLALMTLMLGTLAIPFPFSVSATAFTEMRDSERIYVSTAGVLVESCEEGDKIVVGQRVAKLSNMDLQVEREVVLGRLRQSESRLRSLTALRSLDPDFSSRIPTERENVQGLQDRFVQVEAQLRKLDLIATRDGVFVAPRSKKKEISNQYELAYWDGRPSELKNQNAQLEKGTLFGVVGDPCWHEGFALIQQSAVDLVKPGQSVTFQLGGAPHRKIAGEVIKVSPLEDVEMSDDIRDLLASRFAYDLQMNNVEFGKMYLANIQLEKSKDPILNFESATARIKVAPQSLGARLLRYLNRTFVSLSD